MIDVSSLRDKFENTEFFDAVNVEGYIYFDYNLSCYMSELSDLELSVAALNGAFELLQELNSVSGRKEVMIND